MPLRSHDPAPAPPMLLERARVEPVLADPEGLSCSGTAGEGGIPAQEIRFRGRADMTGVACRADLAGANVRLASEAFSVSTTHAVAVGVEVSREGMARGHHQLRIECYAGPDEPLRIPWR